MTKLDYRNIEKTPGRCGGQATVAGTRIRVCTILVCYRQGMTVAEIMQQYPHLRPADIHDALAYAYDHAEEIDTDLASDDEVVVQQGDSASPANPVHPSTTNFAYNTLLVPAASLILIYNMIITNHWGTLCPPRRPSRKKPVRCLRAPSTVVIC